MSCYHSRVCCHIIIFRAKPHHASIHAEALHYYESITRSCYDCKWNGAIGRATVVTVRKRHCFEMNMECATLPIVIGIDPGTARLGYGIIQDGEQLKALAYGVVETSAHQPMEQRLLALYQELNTLFTQYRPRALALEQLFFARNVTTALTVGQARGIALLVSAQHQIPVFEYKPAEIKQAIVGYGRAEKRQMQEMTRILLGLPDIPRPDDAADALAIALCHLQHARFAARVRNDA